jgi:hypothetical protein
MDIGLPAAKIMVDHGAPCRKSDIMTAMLRMYGAVLPKSLCAVPEIAAGMR